MVKNLKERFCALNILFCLLQLLEWYHLLVRRKPFQNFSKVAQDEQNVRLK